MIRHINQLSLLCCGRGARALFGRYAEIASNLESKA